MQEQEEYDVKNRIFSHLFSKIKKSVLKLEKKPQNSNKLREFICFAVKTIEDCFRKIPHEDQLRSIFQAHRADLVSVVCQTAEVDDPMVQNQAQQLFTLVL